jgi:hypothetical protein
MAASGKQCLTVSATIALGSLCAGSAAWAQYNFDFEGGYVKPCSLAGVNPVHHPEIFGDPGVAREYGFIRSREGNWQVDGKCFGQPKPAAPSTGRPHGKRSGDRHTSSATA